MGVERKLGYEHHLPEWGNVAVLTILSFIQGCGVDLLNKNVSDGTPLPVVGNTTRVEPEPARATTEASDVSNRAEPKTHTPQYPEGTLLLPVTLDDETPIGIQVIGNTLTLFIGEIRCNLIAVTVKHQMHHTNEPLPIIGTDPISLISSVDMNNKGDIRLHLFGGNVELGSSSLEAGIRNAEYCNDGDGLVIEVANVSYTMHLNRAAETIVRQSEELANAQLARNGTLSMTFGAVDSE